MWQSNLRYESRCGHVPARLVGYHGSQRGCRTGKILHTGNVVAIATTVSQTRAGAKVIKCLLREMTQMFYP